MRRTRPSTTRLVLLCFFAASLASGPALAEEDRLPYNIQAALFLKVFGYTDVAKGKPKVVVVGDDPEEAAKVVRAFAEAGGEAIGVKPAAARQELAGAAAVYLFPSTAAAMKELCLELKVLTISGFYELAEAGEVSVAVRHKGNGRPEIVVNLPRTKAESHRFSSDLLALSRVIR